MPNGRSPTPMFGKPASDAAATQVPAGPENFGSFEVEPTTGPILVQKRVKLAAPPPVPPALLCPITQELMDDPCVATDGHTYERAALEAWLLHHDSSPMTGLALDDKWLLVPNLMARSLVHEWREANGCARRPDDPPLQPPCDNSARRSLELRACGPICHHQRPLQRPEPRSAVPVPLVVSASETEVLPQRTAAVTAAHLASFSDRARRLAARQQQQEAEAPPVPRATSVAHTDRRRGSSVLDRLRLRRRSVAATPADGQQRARSSAELEWEWTQTMNPISSESDGQEPAVLC